MADDARVPKQPLDVALAEARDRFGIEAGEGGAEVLALAQDRQPRQPGLEALEAQPLEQAALVGDGPSPLLVVVGDVGRVRLPAANVALTTSFDLDDSVLDADGERLDGLDAGSVRGSPGADVDVRAVAWADRDAVVGIEVALAQRPVVVRAAILERVVLAVQVVDADGDVEPAMTILTLLGGSSSTGADLNSARLLELELVGERRPLLRQRRSLRPWSATFSTPSPRIAHLSRTGRQRDADLLEQLLLRQRGDLGRAPSLHHLHEHRRRGLRDRAAASLELHVLDRVAVFAERDEDRHLVAAERVLSLGMRVGVRERPVPARVLVVVEDHFPVHLVEFAHD